MTPMRLLWRIGGFAALALGIIGIVLPVMPTVPFLILAAWCFGKSSPALEARILAHPLYGPHVRAWREHGAISRQAKLLATVMLSGSAVGALLLAPPPWAYVPLAIGIVTASWIWTRPDKRDG